MQILHLTFWYPSKVHPYKGIFIKEHLRLAQGAGFDTNAIAVCIEVGNTLYQENITIEQVDQTKVIVLTMQSRYWKLLYVVLPFLQYRINRLMKQFGMRKPDIVHAHVLYPAGIIARRISSSCNAKLFITEHWSKVSDFMRNNVFRNKGIKAYRESTSIACVSQYVANVVKNYSQNDIIVIGNPVNRVFFQKTVPCKGQFIFACCATWSEPKRLDLILTALSQFQNLTGQRIKLHVIGDGKQVSMNRVNQDVLNLEITWHGYISKEQIATIYDEVNFFLHASEIETFSIVIAEALCKGIPVIASNVGAIPELINSNNGVLVTNSISDWVNGLQEATAHLYDYSLIAREAQTKFDERIIQERYLSMYKSTQQ